MHSPYKGRKKIIIIRIVRFHGLIQKSTIKPRYCFLKNQCDYYFFKGRNFSCLFFVPHKKGDILSVWSPNFLFIHISIVHIYMHTYIYKGMGL